MTRFRTNDLAWLVALLSLVLISGAVMWASASAFGSV